MSQGGSCVVTIDASEGVARVLFENSSYLGIEYDGAEVGDVISINEGDTEEITIYNAAEAGPLTFDISFSGASELLAGIAALATAAIAI